jgi:hypothetical protein
MPTERVASMPKCVAATIGSAVGSSTPIWRAQISEAPVATRPRDDAARKLSGNDGGGTAPGTPAGRFDHVADGSLVACSRLLLLRWVSIIAKIIAYTRKLCNAVSLSLRMASSLECSNTFGHVVAGM